MRVSCDGFLRPLRLIGRSALSSSRRKEAMLSRYGWSPELRELFDQEFEGRDDLVPGRVSVQQRGILTLVTDQGEVPATLAGRFVRDAAQGDFPVAGDWVGVALQPGRVGGHARGSSRAGLRSCGARPPTAARPSRSWRRTPTSRCSWQR